MNNFRIYHELNNITKLFPRKYDFEWFEESI